MSVRSFQHLLNITDNKVCPNMTDKLGILYLRPQYYCQCAFFNSTTWRRQRMFLIHEKVYLKFSKCDEQGFSRMLQRYLWKHESSHLWTVLQVLVVEQGVVGPEHDPVKQRTVQWLGHGVPHSARLHTDRQSMSAYFWSLASLRLSKTGADTF